MLEFVGLQDILRRDIMRYLLTFYRLDISECTNFKLHDRITDNSDSSEQNVSQKVSHEVINQEQFISILKKCFEPLYHDMYLATNTAFMDDPRLKSEWMSEAINEAKKYYASELKDDEHIFLLKTPKSKIYRNLRTKNFVDDLSGGFILTDRYLYVDENIYKLPISIMSIKKFEVRFLHKKTSIYYL